METLLLEIGTEEIPAGYIEPALDALSSTLLKKMTDARIEHGRPKFLQPRDGLQLKLKMLQHKQTPLDNGNSWGLRKIRI